MMQTVSDNFRKRKMTQQIINQRLDSELGDEVIGWDPSKDMGTTPRLPFASIFPKSAESTEMTRTNYGQWKTKSTLGMRLGIKKPFQNSKTPMTGRNT